MTRTIFEALLLALSLCADCFAVSTCSSVTLTRISWKEVMPIAIVFGFVQTGLMFIGWLFGDIFVGYIEKVANIIGFLLLLYVGGSMVLEALKKDCEVRNLNGIKNVVIGAVATSIDAFAVGISLSMGMTPSATVAADVAAVFLVTILSVIAGMSGGHKIGHKFGKAAELIGGIVLIIIGLNILLGFI